MRGAARTRGGGTDEGGQHQQGGVALTRGGRDTMMRAGQAGNMQQVINMINGYRASQRTMRNWRSNGSGSLDGTFDSRSTIPRSTIDGVPELQA